MHSFQITSASPPCEDPATIRMLIATIRISLHLPDSISAACYDDIGSLLHPLATRLRDGLDGKNAAAGIPDWAEQFDLASTECELDCYKWLGQSLGRATHSALPLHQAILAELERASHRMPFEWTLNVRHLGAIFSLGEIDMRILELAVGAKQATFALHALRVRRRSTKVQIAAAIDAPLGQVMQALAAGGRLARSGILESGFDDTATLHDTLRLSDFGRLALSRPLKPAEALRDLILQPVPAPRHAARWSALTSEQHTIQAILATALETAEPGVNILLCGPRGSDKTEFARHLAGALGCAAYAVPCQDREGVEATPGRRLGALRAALHMPAGPQPALLLLDAARKLLQYDFSNERCGHHEKTGSKAWMKRMLETNPQPLIWITDSIESMDPTYLRRFVFCLHFDPPDTAARRLIAQEHLVALGVTDALISAVARRTECSPALISASARAASLAAGKAGSQDEVVMCHLNSHAKTLQLPTLSTVPQSGTRFDTAYLQVEGRFSAQQVLDALLRHGAGTLLMNGPPGTGKTQLARSIAERLGRELLYYTASDINRKYFGESEQQVARMFTTCDPARQIIFLDEAETILGAREHASHRGAEAVTAEFLRQLEPFPGVFLCATNHGANIDSALIRRFTFRLEFKPLSHAQREMLLTELLALPENGALPAAAQLALARLDGLTPGDFANVRKRFDLLGLAPTPDDWLDQLHQEWRAKPDRRGGAPIGFI